MQWNKICELARRVTILAQSKGSSSGGIRKHRKKTHTHLIFMVTETYLCLLSFMCAWSVISKLISLRDERLLFYQDKLADVECIDTLVSGIVVVPDLNYGIIRDMTIRDHVYMGYNRLQYRKVTKKLNKITFYRKVTNKLNNNKLNNCFLPLN